MHLWHVDCRSLPRRVYIQAPHPRSSRRLPMKDHLIAVGHRWFLPILTLALFLGAAGCHHAGCNKQGDHPCIDDHHWVNCYAAEREGTSSTSAPVRRPSASPRATSTPASPRGRRPRRHRSTPAWRATAESMNGDDRVASDHLTTILPSTPRARPGLSTLTRARP